MINTNGFNRQTGEWNDSLTGEFLWSNTNIGETLADVQTPFTWSMISASFEQMNVMPEYPVVGNIGGRAYNNVSVLVTGMRALGRKIEEINKEMGGVRDEYTDSLPKIIIPLPRPALLPLLWRGLQIRRKQTEGIKNTPAFLSENLDWCNAMFERIKRARSESELAALQTDEIMPYALRAFWMVVGSAWEYGEQTGKLRSKLTDLTEVEDADKLVSYASQEAELLASLGPIVGLEQVRRGELSRALYLEQWGHRGPHESELSTPRPAEDPDWLDKQLAALEQAPVDVDTLLARRRAECDLAWMRFREKFPNEIESTQKWMEKVARAARVREAVRSELVRVIWVGRAWGLRAGELTGLGEGIFFLTTDEAADLLVGSEVSTETIPARRETYLRYKSLPPYPMTIRGHFDPFQWAADPNRRSDFAETDGVLAGIIAEANRQDPGRAALIIGAPGSAGLVEGTVRRLDSPEEGDQLQPGEILVTTQTNIGWSHLFPLTKAIVTDVGAALSHAAIVARELRDSCGSQLRGGHHALEDRRPGAGGWQRRDSDDIIEVRSMNASRRNLYLLTFVMFVVMLGYGIIIPIMPFYIENMGAGGMELGLLVASYAVMRLVCGPIWGSLSDRVGRKPVLMIGILGYAITMIWFGLATQLWMLFAARILSGILSSATAPTTMAYISDSTPEAERGGGMGMLGAAGGIGTILGPALGGFLAGKSLSIPFLIAAGMSILALLLAWVFLPESLPSEDRQPRETKQGLLDVRVWMQTLRSPIGSLFTLTFISTCGLMIFASVFGLYTLERYNFGPEDVGVMMMVLGLVSAISQGVLAGPLTRRWGDEAVIRVGFLLSALGFGVLLLANTYFTVLLATAFFGMATTLQIPALTSLTSKRATVPQGIAMGLSNSFVSLGRIVGPVFGGAVFDINLLLPYLSGTVIMFIGFAVSLITLGGGKVEFASAQKTVGQ